MLLPHNRLSVCAYRRSILLCTGHESSLVVLSLHLECFVELCSKLRYGSLLSLMVMFHVPHAISYVGSFSTSTFNQSPFCNCAFQSPRLPIILTPLPKLPSSSLAQ